MKTRAWLVLLWGLGPLAAGCWTDRPLYVATSDDASPPPTGAAGTTGAAGGGDNTGGGAGNGGSAAAGCDQALNIFRKYICSIAGACHDANGSAAGLSLAELDQSGTVDWRAKFVGVYPKGGGARPSPSMCFPSSIPYLVPGSQPATGLLLDKLLQFTPPCGSRMPLVGGPLSASELGCVQRWADALTAP
jgi:hypothetical protein